MSVTCTTNHELSINLLLFSIRFRVSSLVVVSFVYELNIFYFVAFILIAPLPSVEQQQQGEEEEGPKKRRQLSASVSSLFSYLPLSYYYDVVCYVE